MRTINVQASHSLSSLPHDFWNSHQGLNFRPALNIRAFVELLKSHLARADKETKANENAKPNEDSEDSEEEPATRSKGKKRAAAPRRRPIKRAKVDQSSGDRGDVDKTFTNVLAEWPEGYHAFPLLQIAPRASSGNTRQRILPAFLRTDEIQFTTDAAQRRPQHWSKEEELLKQALSAVSESRTQPDTFDLGIVKLADYRGRIVVISPKYHQDWLLLLPLETDEVDSHEDILACCLIANGARQLDVDATLRCTILPPGACDTSAGELPFCLQVETTCSFRFPALLSQPDFHYKADVKNAHEALRRCLNYLYPSGTDTPGAFKGDIDIPYFYSILKPAPSLPSRDFQSVLQPKALLPKLLPFQRRSVAWLLAREGKAILPSGEVTAVDSMPMRTDSDSLLFFWRKVEESNQCWYFNRLSGDVSRDPPVVENALGGILAEEPGLGKTLETISLILLNPAPERVPSTSRWDPSARLDVGEVKATLIVTPLSLATQWADELAKHAPSLKVLFYEGWSKLTVPITAADAGKLRVKLKKERAKSEAKSKGKGTKSKSSTPVPNGRRKAKAATTPQHPDDVMDWPTYVNTFDVVITTYPVLRSEVNVARAPPVRPRREDVVYQNVERPRSPLVSVEWLRVVMDEVQMAGGGRTEDMVSLIPRLSSLAVSGTPAKGQVSDLIHVLKFLRIENVIGPQKLWNRLLQPSHAREFATFFEHFAVRTTKTSVKDELTIPTQTRYLVPITLGRVERHVYDQNLETALLQLGLDARGVAASDGWDIDGALLRTCLRRLRGICTHPQVGQLHSRNIDKLSKSNTLKTMDEVLEAMKDNNWRTTMEDRRTKVNALVTQAQLLQMERDNANRYQLALQVLQLAEADGKSLIEELRGALTALEDKVKKDNNTRGFPDQSDPSNKGKGKAKETEEEEDDIQDDGSTADTSLSAKKGALNNRLRDATIILHRVYFAMGDVHHILGRSAEEDRSYGAAEALRQSVLQNAEKDAANAMSDLMTTAADEGIEQDALLIEAPLLTQGPQIRVIEDRRRRARASDRAAAGLSPLPSSSEEDSDSDSDTALEKKKAKAKKPVRISTVIEEINSIATDPLNKQAALLWEWRSRIAELLTRRLTPGEGDGADGQEYQRSLDDQGEVESYMQAYSALLADYREALVKERTLLAALEVREKRTRGTRAAAKATAAEAEGLRTPEDVELNVNHRELHEDLTIQRRVLLLQLDGRAVKSCLTDIKDRMAKIKSTKDPEKVLLAGASSTVQTLISGRIHLLNKFDTDLARFRKVFNLRVVYFAQLQEISDSVAQPVIETTLRQTIDDITTELENLNIKINAGKSRDRYLKHLAAASKDGDDIDEEDRVCILCRCDFIRGFITHCAHIFCEPCLRAWMSRKEGKTCPVCRVAIDAETMQAFTTDELDKSTEKKSTGDKDKVVPKSRRVIEYNCIDPTLFKEIQSMDSFGDFGSKIQTLVKHLLYLQWSEPGAKSICFSAWQDSLHILERALHDNGTLYFYLIEFQNSYFTLDIPCLRIDQSRGQGAAKRFRTDPKILVLLLHGERENAGLNVTCASRVFLLESVVHHGFEIQAIARIDRMGQTKSTEVFCYYAEGKPGSSLPVRMTINEEASDTVEKYILDLAARQGLSLYTTDSAAGTLNTTKFSGSDGVQKAKYEAKTKKSAQKGDFIGKVDDMLAILFPHMYEDAEYLVADNDTDVGVDENIEDDAMVTSQMEVAGPSTRSRRRPPPQVNAEAGPSRPRRR